MQLALQALTVDTRWTVDTQRKVFSVDASDLGYKPGQTPSQPLYDDAVDEGIELFNPMSGNTTRWFERLQSTGVQFWEYKPTSESVQKFPSLAGWSVRIYND